MGSYKISIDSIKCISQKDAKGEAEIWLLAQSDGGPPKRYPPQPLSAHDIDEDETWLINGDLDLEFNGCCQLTIYEQDFDLSINATDFLGCVSFTADSDDSIAKIATNGSNSGDREYSEFAVSFSWIK